MKRKRQITTGAMWILGIGGWLTSWAYFSKWMFENDWHFVGGWLEAFTTSDFSTGLHLDLVFVTFMVIGFTLAKRKTLGFGWTLAVLLSLPLSVSMALAVFIAGYCRARIPEERT